MIGSHPSRCEGWGTRSLGLTRGPRASERWGFATLILCRPLRDSGHIPFVSGHYRARLSIVMPLRDYRDSGLSPTDFGSDASASPALRPAAARCGPPDRILYHRAEALRFYRVSLGSRDCFPPFREKRGRMGHPQLGGCGRVGHPAGFPQTAQCERMPRMITTIISVCGLVVAVSSFVLSRVVTRRVRVRVHRASFKGWVPSQHLWSMTWIPVSITIS